MVKNKVAPPYREAEFDIMYGEGISRMGELLDLAVKHDVVQKSGAWFSYGETRLGQGRDNAKIYLKNNPELAKEVEEKLLAALHAKREDTPPPAPATSQATPVQVPAAKAKKTAAAKADIDITVDD